MAVRRAASLLLALVFSLVALALPGPSPVVAAEPNGYEYFHTYAEMGVVIDKAVAGHPSIAAKFSIGQSHEGRAIRAIRLTANVNGGNHGRPEVLIQGLMHGRERASSELAIHMIKVLANNYGRDTTLGRRVTAILQSTVVYIIPMLNPDGGEFDLKNGKFHKWRKNRQPIPGSSAIGVDLNRQFGYTWNCCGGSSGKPSSQFYRGPEPWFAPEVRAYRDFVNWRIDNGNGKLKQILSLHSAGRLVLWPYAYTRKDVPADMRVDDHKAMVALGTGMAQRNGYRAKQASDLYIVDGDADDWAYGRHSIFAFTIEMARGSAKRYYPSRRELKTDLKRNRKAILWFLEQSDCPYRAAGLAARYCDTQVTQTATRFAQSVYDSAAVQPQKTNCWCVVASARAWLRHANTSFALKQNEINAYMTQNDKNDWTDPGTSFYIRCTRGTPSPSFAHDGRGLAWTLWNHASADNGLGFNDYLGSSAGEMNWQIVRNIRATGQPVGAVVARGRHAVLVVGYKTSLDPLADGGANKLYGMRVWDPWYGAGFGNWSGWPSGGFAGNAYVTRYDWNNKYFRPDTNEGPYYYGRYVAILPSSTSAPPSDDPPPSYGQVVYEQANGSASSSSWEGTSEDRPATTVGLAVAQGLREHDLLGDPDLGNLPASYSIGNSMEVESLDSDVPSYQLVELKVGDDVRAVALVNETSAGYVFGELREVIGDWALPTRAELRSRLAANGLTGDARLVWGWTDERNPPFAPFLAGTNATTGRPAFVTAAGVTDRLDLVREPRPTRR
jgi:hypothetical protein